MAYEPSVEPSSTITNSKSLNVCARTESIDSARYRSTLYAGITTLTEGIGARLRRAAARQVPNCCEHTPRVRERPARDQPQAVIVRSKRGIGNPILPVRQRGLVPLGQAARGTSGKQHLTVGRKPRQQRIGASRAVNDVHAVTGGEAEECGVRRRFHTVRVLPRYAAANRLGMLGWVPLPDVEQQPGGTVVAYPRIAGIGGLRPRAEAHIGFDRGECRNGRQRRRG